MKFETEDQLQAYCFLHWSSEYRHKSFLFAVPNGGSRVPAEAVKLKSTGVRAGVSDLVLVAPGGQVHFIEMKNGQQELRDVQQLFKQKMEALQHNYYVCYTFEDFKQLLIKLLTT